MRLAISAIPLLGLLAACGGGGGGGGGSEEPPDPRFTHGATIDTIDGASTQLTHPLLDGNPDARLVVTHVLNPDAGIVTVKDRHPVGVQYVEFRGHWEIVNLDGAAMPAGAAFFVQVLEDSESFVHMATPDNTDWQTTDLSHAWINGNPDVDLIVTQYAGAPDTPLYVPNPKNVGVFYSYTTGVWHIFNQDRTPMPPGAQFFVAIPRTPRTSFTHDTTAHTVGGSAGERTSFTHVYVDGYPSAHLHITGNWNPPDEAGVYNDHPTAAFYDIATGFWAVANADDALMPLGASFNIWIP